MTIEKNIIAEISFLDNTEDEYYKEVYDSGTSDPIQAMNNIQDYAEEKMINMDYAWYDITILNSPW